MSSFLKIITHEGNVNQNYNRIPLCTLTRMAIIKKADNNSVGKDMEKVDHSYTAGENFK